MTASLIVSEIFGPTFQGEGPAAGKTATFLRLGKCNLTCVWCDTAYTWDWSGVTGTAYDKAKELTTMPVDAVKGYLREKAGTQLLVVSGGEPLLQAKSLVPVLEVAVEAPLFGEVHVETNGTIAPPAELTATVNLFVVSPKLRHSGVSRDKAIRDRAIAEFRRIQDRWWESVAWKFVVQDRHDLSEVDAFVTHYGVPSTTVWIMPEGMSPDVIVSRGTSLADEIAYRGWNMTLRMQQLLWPKERAR